MDAAFSPLLIFHGLRHTSYAAAMLLLMPCRHAMLLFRWLSFATGLRAILRC